MFESNTEEAIIERVLERIPDDIDKREGSISFDIIAALAQELAEVYIGLDIILEEGFADTASYEYLAKRCAERGMLPYEATYAVVKSNVLPEEIQLEVGERFVIEDIVYAVVEKLGTGTYKLECETEGVEGNRHFGEMLPMGYVDGLESIHLTEVLIPGEEEESEEELRNRYYSSFDNKTFGGNIADYKKYVAQIDGAGVCKIERAFLGGGTVKLILLDSNYNTPSKELIEKVKNEIDPDNGEGTGTAPIGHVVTVIGAVDVPCVISANISFLGDYSYERCRESLEGTVKEYMDTLRKSWENSKEVIVRIKQIERALLSVEGVEDVSNTKINEDLENIIVSGEEIPLFDSLVVV